MTDTEQNVETSDSDQQEPNTVSKENSQTDIAQQLEGAQQQAADYRDKMLRMQAEMENLRKRTERDVSNAHKYANEKFANELLQVKDSLEMGLNISEDEIDLEKLKEGTELTLKMLTSAFEKFSIEEINPVGEAFDPNMHEAMTMQESTEHKPNTVLMVMQKGYTLHGRLIRPAMVIVSKAAQ